MISYSVWSILMARTVPIWDPWRKFRSISRRCRVACRCCVIVEVLAACSSGSSPVEVGMVKACNRLAVDKNE